MLYGPSGVGKSSLLRAAVARSLRELPEQPLVVVFSSWSDDPNAALAEAVAEAPGCRERLAVAALERAQAERDVYLVLDQAEEYFLYHADDGAGRLVRAMRCPPCSRPLRVNVLVSLREDSLAKLDRFTGRIPSLFANTLRLDRLDRAAARAAIVAPGRALRRARPAEPVAIEPELVERVLDEVGAGQIEPALGGLGAVEGSEPAARIEAPYLQLVMQRLWEEERAAGSDALRARDARARSEARSRSSRSTSRARWRSSPTDEKDVAARLFNHLVTPSGTKIAHDVSDLADFGERADGGGRSRCCRRLARAADPALGRGGRATSATRSSTTCSPQPVLAWRAAHEAERELEGRSANPTAGTGVSSSSWGSGRRCSRS